MPNRHTRPIAVNSNLEKGYSVLGRVAVCRAGISSALLLCLAFMPSGYLSDAQAATVPRPQVLSFCKVQFIPDYVSPWKGLPEVRSMPAEGKLPFGPGNIFVEKSGDGPVVFGAGKVGATIYNRYVRGVPPRADLDWLFTLSLVQVDRRGRRLGAARLISKRIGDLGGDEEVSLLLQVNRGPAIYRLGIGIFDQSRKPLGQFGEYVRVMRERPSRARLALNKSSFYSGESVEARIENRGPRSLFFGLSYRVEAFDGDDWTASAIQPPPMPLIGLSIRPAEAASCWRFQIPPEAAVGRYRLAVEVSLLLPGQAQRRRFLTARSSFDVLTTSPPR